jgi:fatty-acid desaturase
VICDISDHWKRITVGYHRLYSHRSFNASVGIRAVLALVGASAFQGSIKVIRTFVSIALKVD